MSLGYSRPSPSLLTVALLTLAFVCIPDNGHAQPVPVTKIEHVAGDERERFQSDPFKLNPGAHATGTFFPGDTPFPGDALFLGDALDGKVRLTTMGLSLYPAR